MQEQRSRCQQLVKLEVVEAYTREYFYKDKIILLDSSMLNVEGLPRLVINNLFFNNSIWISEETEKEIQQLVLSTQKDLEVRQNNAKVILTLLSMNRVCIIKGLKQEGEFDFLKKCKNAILYTESKQREEQAKEKNVRMRKYNSLYSANRYKPERLRFETLRCAEKDAEKLYVSNDLENPHNSIEKIVYNRHCVGDKEYLIRNESSKKYLRPDDLIIIKNKRRDIKTFLVYLVANKHTKNNVVRLFWTDIPIEREYDWSYVPEDLRPLIQAEY